MAKKTLIIVESPNKARKISKFLGSDFIVQASYGHVVDLTHSGLNNLGVDLENNFTPDYSIISDKKDKVKLIIKYAEQSDKIYLAPDPDREGEAIAWHLADILKKTKKPIKRITFNSITKGAILNSIKNPRDLDLNLFDAQQARRVLDRIVGFSVTPFLMKKFGSNLSAGRVQSVAVRLIVDREEEINSFLPEEYWNVIANLEKEGEPFSAKYIKKVLNGAQAHSLKKELENDIFVVDNIEEVEQQKKPFPPFITSTLAASAAGKYKFSAARTMKAAQSLYESGIITYMRTDSVRIEPEAIDFCREWLKENGYDLPLNSNNYIVKGTAQDAHEAIRPTDVSVTPKNVYLNDDEHKIYTLIWERFVACQMKPAIYDSVNVFIKTSKGYELKSSGRCLKYKGWLEICNEFKKSDDINLPLLKIKDKLNLIAPYVEITQKFTKPPPRFTEKTLIEELEKRGIGRPSTYASIMAKISDRDYVNKQSNTFVPTEKGKNVVNELVKFFKFMEYGYTADMENQLDKIAAGQQTYLSMMNDFYKLFKIQLNEAHSSNNKDFGFRCTKCGNDTPMFLHKGKFGYFLACINYPDNCKNTISCELDNGKPKIKKNSKRKIDQNVKCPVCKSGMVKIEGNYGVFYGCSEYPLCNGKLNTKQ